MSSQYSFSEFLGEKKKVSLEDGNSRKLWDKYKDEYYRYCIDQDYVAEDWDSEIKIIDVLEEERIVKEKLEEKLGREPTDEEIEAEMEAEDIKEVEKEIERDRREGRL